MYKLEKVPRTKNKRILKISIQQWKKPLLKLKNNTKNKWTVNWNLKVNSA